jgi:hypothetical protein
VKVWNSFAMNPSKTKPEKEDSFTESFTSQRKLLFSSLLFSSLPFSSLLTYPPFLSSPSSPSSPFRRIPIWIRKVIRGAEQALRVEERSWHIFPYIKTVYTCPLLGGRLTFIVETQHTNDGGYTHNVTQNFSLLFVLNLVLVLVLILALSSSFFSLSLFSSSPHPLCSADSRSGRRDSCSTCSRVYRHCNNREETLPKG